MSAYPWYPSPGPAYAGEDAHHAGALAEAEARDAAALWELTAGERAMLAESDAWHEPAEHDAWCREVDVILEAQARQRAVEAITTSALARSAVTMAPPAPPPPQTPPPAPAEDPEPERSVILFPGGPFRRQPVDHDAARTAAAGAM